jgi:cell wall-associated NlpC family hydrolase
VSAAEHARRAAALALAMAEDHAHVLPGAAGSRPGRRDGTRRRPAGVQLEVPRTDPADPAVFAARCGAHVCGGRFDQTAGGIAGGRPARRTDIDLLVYLAELAAQPEADWLPFFEFFSPRTLGAGSGPRLTVWGEDCRGRRHFDGPGLVNWCLEQAVDARYPIDLAAADWTGEAAGTTAVPVDDPPRPGDVVAAERDGADPALGILVGDDGDGGVVVAEHTAVGVVRLPFAPAGWTWRRRPAELLHG